MNPSENKYNRYALVREMAQTPAIIAGFDPSIDPAFARAVSGTRRMFLTGEGSSRIFPAKRAIYETLRRGLDLWIATEGATQALEYDLRAFAVFAASNSGQTKEVIRLFRKLKDLHHPGCYGITANSGTRLEELASRVHILGCGKEDAIAATKSVVEQALFYDAVINGVAGERMEGLESFATRFNQALTLEIDPVMVKRISRAGTIYFAGANNGVAEELTLKTNEITRKRSGFLEGTYAVHGIEEVMRSDDLLIWIDPFEEEIDKFHECLVEGVGLEIIALSTKPTRFPTIVIPDGGRYSDYIGLAAGWNILVETGLELGIDLDKPERARKVGNEYIP